jgi:predicted GNAT superfamily acetyltransferase
VPEPVLPTLSPGDLGFVGSAVAGWRKTLRGVSVAFRPLRMLADLAPVERLQLDVFGMTERDLVSATELVVVPETGGEVLGAFVPGDVADDLAGVLIGWGGWVDRRPRLVSDFLAVEPRYRNLGLGAELKGLQAALAIERGFVEVVWTVDPLRAANARLNFEKLGAVADGYERDRYGAEFGVGLYGGMVSDRLHVRWEIDAARPRHRLRLGPPRRNPAADAALPPWTPGLGGAAARVAIPDDIDGLLARDPEAARRWRLEVRAALEEAFAEGWRVGGFAPRTEPTRAASSLVLERGVRDAGASAA